MALSTFYYGGFTGGRESAEWDGTNHDEIVAWMSDPQATWTVGAVTASHLTVVANGGARTIVLPVGWWIGKGYYANPIDPSRFWRTPDPYGRPVNAADIEAP